MNAYPEKPTVPFHPTPVTKDALIAALQALNAPAVLKRMAMVILRNESQNGEKVFNNNPCGFQADAGRWPAQYDIIINGVIQHKENGTGKVRIFLSFAGLADAIGMLCGRLGVRGIYEGGTTHKITNMTLGTIQPNQDAGVQQAIIGKLCTAYIREWCTGSATAQPSGIQLRSFASMYKQAIALFP